MQISDEWKAAVARVLDRLAAVGMLEYDDEIIRVTTTGAKMLEGIRNDEDIRELTDWIMAATGGEEGTRA